MFRGCMVALVTPFRNGDVDYNKIDELVDFHLEKGSDGLVPCGTTGESPTLSHQEHEKVIARVIERVAGRIPVVAGTGSNNTAEALRLTRFAKEVGADGALMITPYYNKPEPEGMYRHFKTVAEEVDIPIVLYNVPGRTGRSITPETVERLSAVPNIVAIKEASLSLELVSDIRRRCDITILSGEDSLTLPLMSLGATGAISVVGNVAPALMAEMIRVEAAGDHQTALDLHLKLFPLCKAMFVETNPIPVKAALKMMGLLNGELRLPLSPLSADKEPQLKAVLQEFDLCP